VISFSLCAYCDSKMVKQFIKIGLVSISDRASQGVYEDKGIPSLQTWLKQALVTPFEVIARLIPDEQEDIEIH